MSDGSINSIDLHVRVADAQGLRLLPGGEIRLVITLRASDDPQGEAFGAKVTPWLPVPKDQAPQWRARGAIFSVPVQRCCQAAFQDSVYLHISLMQRGHSATVERPQPSPTAPKGLVASLKQKATSTLPVTWPLPLSNTHASKGDAVGALSLLVGKQLACADGALAEECSEWLQLIPEGGEEVESRRGKGWLLLEIAALPCLPEGGVAAPNVGLGQTNVEAAGGARTGQGQGPGAASREEGQENAVGEDGGDAEGKEVQDVPQSPRGLQEELSVSESASECGAASDAEGWASGSGAASGSGVLAARAQRVEPDPDAEEPASPLPAGQQELLSPRSVARLLASAAPGSGELRASHWLPFGKEVAQSHVPEGFDCDASLNIFTINNPTSSSKDQSGPGQRGLQRLLRGWSEPQRRIRPLRQVRSTLDPQARRQKREAKKWRQWHEVFCTLNDMERQLAAAVGLFVQAAASMRRFGESHAALQDIPRLSAFLGDACLYFRSEAGLPERLAEHLDDLELVADDFRSISIEPSSTVEAVHTQHAVHSLEGSEAPGSEEELCTSCEDLQVDVAVLLESTLMAAQQALAEYKRMHCRLELLATEYEPICRLELESSSPVLLPLLTERSDQVAAASLPEQVVQWALDFSQLVGGGSMGLQRLVRELEHRRCQLKVCCEELRALMLRCAASGVRPRECPPIPPG